MKSLILFLPCIVIHTAFSISSHRDHSHHRTHHRVFATISSPSPTDDPATHLVLGTNASPIQTPWFVAKDNDSAHVPLKVPSAKAETRGEFIAFSILFGTIAVIVLISLGWTIWRWHWRSAIRKLAAEDSDISIPMLIEQPEEWRSIPGFPVIFSAVEQAEPPTITRYPSWHRVGSSGFSAPSYCSEDGFLQLHARRTYCSRKSASCLASSAPSLVGRNRSKSPTVQSMLPSWATETETFLRASSISMPRLPPLARLTLLAPRPLIPLPWHNFFSEQDSEAAGSGYASEDSDDAELTLETLNRMRIRRVIPAGEDKTGIGIYRPNKNCT